MMTFKDLNIGDKFVFSRDMKISRRTLYVNVKVADEPFLVKTPYGDGQYSKEIKWNYSPTDNPGILHYCADPSLEVVAILG